MATNKGRLPVNAEHLTPRAKGKGIAGQVKITCPACGAGSPVIYATAANARKVCAEDSRCGCAECGGRLEVACLDDHAAILPETVSNHSLFASVEGELARADEAKAEREARRVGASLEGISCYSCEAPAPANANREYWYCSVCHSANSAHPDGDRAVSKEQPFGAERERARGMAIDRPARKVRGKGPRVTEPADDGIPF